MKYIIHIAMVAFCLNSSAQITLEQTYDSASTVPTSGPSNQLLIINFEVSGERYVKINYVAKTIYVYNMNHSLQKIISFAGFPSLGSSINILYISENLFDLDSDIDFMYSGPTGINTYYTGIYNEDESLIFSDTGAPVVKVNTPLQQYPIYNTIQGSKMILSFPNGEAKVFSLPGTLSTAIAEANGQLMQTQNGQFNNLYPNPSYGEVTLQYKLPEGEKEGELILYNMQGVEVKRYKVDNTFKDVLIDNSQLPAGNYFYNLQTSKGTVGTKKMIVIK